MIISISTRKFEHPQDCGESKNRLDGASFSGSTGNGSKHIEGGALS